MTLFSIQEGTSMNTGLKTVLSKLTGNITAVLTIILVVAAFLLGSLYTKVQYLEKNNTLGTNAQAAAPNQPGQQAPAAPQNATISLGHLPIKGNKNAKVAVVEFADFRCPFCERFFQETEPSLMKDYVDSGKVQFAYRHFQFLGRASVVAGNASECANEQNKFWEFHDYLYKNQPSESDTSMYNTDTLTMAAQSLGINVSQFKSCLDGKKYDKNVSKDYADGQAAGVTGTPTTIIGKIKDDGTIDGTIVVGAVPYATLKAVIDPLLK